MLDHAAQGFHLLRRTGDADDAHRSAVHADGQIDPPPGSLLGRVLMDHQAVQPLLQKRLGPRMDLTHTGRVRTGKDSPRVVHQVDVTPCRRLHLLHDRQRSLLRYQHTASSIVF